MDVYLLPSGAANPNIVTAMAGARTYLANQRPGFLSSGGQLAEYAPLDGDRWRIYGEISGRTQLYLDVSATQSGDPVLVDVTPGRKPTPASGSAAGDTCFKKAESSSDVLLCLLDELGGDQPVPSPAPAPPPTTN